MPTTDYRIKLIVETRQSHQNQIAHLETEMLNYQAGDPCIQSKVHPKQTRLFPGYEIWTRTLEQPIDHIRNGVVWVLFAENN